MKIPIEILFVFRSQPEYDYSILEKWPREIFKDSVIWSWQIETSSTLFVFNVPPAPSGMPMRCHLLLYNYRIGNSLSFSLKKRSFVV